MTWISLCVLWKHCLCFLKVAQAGWRTWDLLIFVYFISELQRLRPRGYPLLSLNIESSVPLTPGGAVRQDAADHEVCRDGDPVRPELIAGLEVELLEESRI